MSKKHSVRTTTSLPVQKRKINGDTMRLSLDQTLTVPGVRVPPFDVGRIQRYGVSHPRWVHVGPGNIFRGFLARIAEDTVSSGDPWPITAVETMDAVRLERQLAQFDLMSLAVTLMPDGQRDLRVIAGVCEGLAVARSADLRRLRVIAAVPELSLVSLTITEKGYIVTDSAGELLPAVANEIETGPSSESTNAMVLLASLLWFRFSNSAAPITLLSCDNFSHNGDVLRDSINVILLGWHERGFVSDSFLEWFGNRQCVSFPISVIDKITPQPDPKIAAELKELGIEGMELDFTHGAPLAGFVNTEPAEYLVIEDAFAGERPPFEEFGVFVTDRKTCDDFERMKVTTCLNPLHTALALGGSVLGIGTIDQAVTDPSLNRLVVRLAHDEGLPVVTDPGIVSPEAFLEEVLTVRFPNSYLPDTPGRIATDTSQKLSIRFGETIKEYLVRGIPLDSLRAIPLVFALWCRYLLGVDDNGNRFTPSPDPLLPELNALLAEVEVGQQIDVHRVLNPILSNPHIFGLDLYTTPIGAQVERYFSRLIAGFGAVRQLIDSEI